MIDEEGKLIKEIDRARLAQDVLDNQVYQEAFAVYRQTLTEKWSESPARDTEGRERIWLMLKTAEMVESHLKTLMETGKMAAIQLEQKRNLAQRMRGMWGGTN